MLDATDSKGNNNFATKMTSTEIQERKFGRSKKKESTLFLF